MKNSASSSQGSVSIRQVLWPILILLSLSLLSWLFLPIVAPAPLADLAALFFLGLAALFALCCWIAHFICQQIDCRQFRRQEREGDERG